MSLAELKSCKEMPLPAGLESQALDILNVKHPLDSPDFNTTEYINQLFPNEQSLTSLDSVMSKIQQKTAALRRETERLTMAPLEKGCQGVKELEGITDAIQNLFQKTQDIKTNATQSEAMVQDITQDVKSLDDAKRKLTDSVTVLRRLQMLVTAVDQLELMSEKKQYKETPQLVLAVVQLMQHFETYRSVPQIAKLSDRITKLQNKLERDVLREFDHGFDTQGELTHKSDHLPEACLIASALRESTREKMIKRYIDLQLTNYRNIFRPSEEVSQLDNISRRFAWLKRKLKTCEEQHRRIFPPDWNISRRVSETFCSYTKTDLDQILAADQPKVKELLNALQLTIKFEAELSKKFRQAGDGDGPFFCFEKSISASFHPYLWIYIEDTESELTRMIDGYVGSSQENMKMLESSTDLFFHYQQKLEECKKLSTGGAFRDLHQLFSKYLCLYCDKVLVGGLTRYEKLPITAEHFPFACLVLNTADYWLKETTNLEAKLLESIDEELKGSVSLQDAKDKFESVLSKSINTLVVFLNKSLEPPLDQMTREKWGTMDSVGDQSAHVSQLQTIGRQYIAVLGSMIVNRRYFRTFGDRFAATFLQKYLLMIFRCKPISVEGAQQMRLDTHGVRAFLEGIPTAGAASTGDTQRSFGKLVDMGIKRVEAILKTVMAPTNPPDGYVGQYLELIKDKNDANFTRLLELKGLSSFEQKPLVEVFQQQKGRYDNLADNSHIVPSAEDLSHANVSSTLPHVISTMTTSISPTATSPSPGRLNENIRRFATKLGSNINFRKDSHERRD